MKAPDPKISKKEIFNKLENLSKKDKKVCFIFGAGASYGYIDNKKNRFLPPIVNHLLKPSRNSTVDHVIKKDDHKAIHRASNYLSKALVNFNNDLEEYLAHIYQQNSDDDIFKHFLKYLYDVYKESSENVDTMNNNYQELINRSWELFNKKGWSCVSFNYDTILEQSYIGTLRHSERTFSEAGHYIKTHPRIIKIHGSINFRYIFTIPRASKKSYRYKDIFNLMMNEGLKPKEAGVFTFNPNFEDPGFKNKGTKWNEEKEVNERVMRYNIPLMMIPIHGTQEPKNIIFKNLIEGAKNEIKNADLVISIGYNFGDKLFSKKLKNINISEKELIMVGTSNLYKDPYNHPGFKNASKIWNRPKVFEGNGFSEFTDAIIGHS